MMIYVICSGRESSRKFENGKEAQATDCKYVWQKTCLLFRFNATLMADFEKRRRYLLRVSPLQKTKTQ